MNADWLTADLNKIVAVSLNASGKIVKGTAGQSGFVGIVCLTKALKANDIVDVMQTGEVVELTGLAAGTQYYAASTGEGVNTTNTNPRVGWTVEATRMIVRCNVSGDVIGTA